MEREGGRAPDRDLPSLLLPHSIIALSPNQHPLKLPQIFFTFKIPNLISCYWTAEQIPEQSNFFWNPTKNFIFTSNHQPNVSNFNTFTRYTINFTFILWLNKDVDFLCCCFCRLDYVTQLVERGVGGKIKRIWELLLSQLFVPTSPNLKQIGPRPKNLDGLCLETHCIKKHVSTKFAWMSMIIFICRTFSFFYYLEHFREAFIWGKQREGKSLS